jgi:hypothetical protein
MDPGLYALALMFLLLPFASWIAWKVWSGRDTALRFYSDQAARGLPVTVALMWLFCGLAVGLAIAHGVALAVIAAVEFVVLIAMLVLIPSVHLRGWPKRFVPPHLRISIGSPDEANWRVRSLVSSPRERPGTQGQPHITMPESRPSAARSVYRDPWAVACRLVALLLFLAVEAYMFLTGISGPAFSAVFLVFTLILWVAVLRAGVLADADGVTVVTQLNKRVRLSWSEIERFELDRTTGDLPHACAVLKDGKMVSLEPLEGVEMEPKKRRWDWAERSIAGLSSQLDSARGKSTGGPKSMGPAT